MFINKHEALSLFHSLLVALDSVLVWLWSEPASDINLLCAAVVKSTNKLLSNNWKLFDIVRASSQQRDALHSLHAFKRHITKLHLHGITSLTKPKYTLIDLCLPEQCLVWITLYLQNQGKTKRENRTFTKQKRSLCLLYFQSSNKSKYQNSIAGENILHHEQQGLRQNSLTDLSAHTLK